MSVHRKNSILFVRAFFIIGLLVIVRLDNWSFNTHTPLILPLEEESEIPQSNQKTTAVIGGLIIDGTGRTPIRDGVILIRGKKIVAIGNRDKIVLPKGTREINANGKYIIPGLMDSNVHFVICRTIEFLARHEKHFEDLIEEAAQVTLKHGITTVFETWGPLQPLLNVRDRINQGKTVGSRLFVAGNCIGMSGPLGRDLILNPEAKKFVTNVFANRINAMWEENVGPELGFMTEEQVRAEIRKYISRGVDFLKYASSGHNPGHKSFIVFSEKVQKAIVEEGHKANLSVQAHTTSVESLRIAIQARVDLITHCEATGPNEIPDSIISTLIKNKIPCGIFPRTKRRYEIEINKGGKSLLMKKDTRTVIVERKNEIKLIKSGIPLLLNTDGGLWGPEYIAQSPADHWIDYGAIIGKGYFFRIKAMSEVGMSPMDIILAGTRNIAAAYRKLAKLGTLEEGKLADLVILDANPLADINNIRKIFIVMKEGQVVDRERLPIKKIIYPAQPKLF